MQYAKYLLYALYLIVLQTGQCMHVYIHTSGMQEALHNWGEGHNNLSRHICMENNYISMGLVIVKLHRGMCPLHSDCIT